MQVADPERVIPVKVSAKPQIVGPYAAEHNVSAVAGYTLVIAAAKLESIVVRWLHVNAAPVIAFGQDRPMTQL